MITVVRKHTTSTEGKELHSIVNFSDGGILRISSMNPPDRHEKDLQDEIWEALVEKNAHEARLAMEDYKRQFLPNEE